MVSNETLLKDYKGGDIKARDTLCSRNMGLVVSIAKRFTGSGVDIEDLAQTGSLGLLKAIDNFDEGFGVKFSTYAVPMIAGEIKRFLRDDGEIKISRAIKTLSMKIRVFIDEFKKKNMIEPTLQEIAVHFNVEPEEVVCALDSSRAMISLYEKIDDNSDNSANLIDKIIVEDNSDIMLDKILLKQAIEELNEREKKVILLRYFRGKTQSEVANLLNVSQVQVSRIESKILENLKRKLN